MMALSLTGLYYFFPEKADIRRALNYYNWIKWCEFDKCKS